MRYRVECYDYCYGGLGNLINARAWFDAASHGAAADKFLAEFGHFDGPRFAVWTAPDPLPEPSDIDRSFPKVCSTCGRETPKAVYDCRFKVGEFTRECRLCAGCFGSKKQEKSCRECRKLLAVALKAGKG